MDDRRQSTSMKAESILKELTRIQGSGVVMTTEQAQSLYQLIADGWYRANVVDRDAEGKQLGYLLLLKHGTNRFERYRKCAFIFPNGEYQCRVDWI